MNCTPLFKNTKVACSEFTIFSLDKSFVLCNNRTNKLFGKNIDMIHLIMISPDQTFSYKEIPGSAPEIRAEILDGKNRAANTGFDPKIYYLAGMRFDVHIWNDWLVVIPVNHDEMLPGKQPFERRLSRRQLDVLLCLSEGMTGKQIALRLNIHTRSVSLHISALKRNLAANTAAECVQKAARLGILKPGGR